jgi:hypothetical protein
MRKAPGGSPRAYVEFSKRAVLPYPLNRSLPGDVSLCNTMKHFHDHYRENDALMCSYVLALLDKGE